MPQIKAENLLNWLLGLAVFSVVISASSFVRMHGYIEANENRVDELEAQVLTILTQSAYIDADNKQIQEELDDVRRRLQGRN